MRVPQIPDLSVFQTSAQQYDGLIAGLNQLFAGFGSALSAQRKNRFALAPTDQGRTLGAFLSVLTGGQPTQPVTAVTPQGVQRAPVGCTSCQRKSGGCTKNPVTGEMTCSLGGE